MAENEKQIQEGAEEEYIPGDIRPGDVYLLTDLESNEEAEYEVLDVAELDGVKYVAVVPSGVEVEEYAILRCDSDEENDFTLSIIEDDDEWEKVAVYFDDKFANEDENYDE